MWNRSTKFKRDFKSNYYIRYYRSIVWDKFY